MKKTGALFIAAALSICVLLTRCGNDTSSPGSSFVPVAPDTNQGNRPDNGGFQPTPENSMNLTPEIENEILQVYLSKTNEKSGFDLTLEDVWIERFHGFYKHYAAVLLFNKYTIPQGYVNDELEVVVGGVSFFYGPIISAQIVLYKEGIFYGLREAYRDNLLSKADLENIAYLQNEGVVFPERTRRSPTDEKIIWDGDINQDFNDTTVLVVMDKNYSSWRFYASDFIGVNIAAVRSLSVLRLMSESALVNRENYHDILAIEIGNPGKQNVVNAIRELEKLDFVMSAGPDYMYAIVE